MSEYRKTLLEAAEEQLQPVLSGNRYQHSRFWDGAHSAPGEPTSWHPEVLSAYHERQRQLGLPGIWRNGQARNNGTQRDVVHYIIEW